MRSRAAALAATLAVGLLYVVLLIWVVPVNGLWSGDQGAKIVQVISLIQHRFSSGAISNPSAGIDPEGRFSALPALFTWPHNGSYYSIFSYPHALLSTPWFFLFGYAGLYVVPVGATLGTLMIGSALGERLGLRILWTIPLLLGVATPIGFYALVFWEHALATGVTTGALLCALLALTAPRHKNGYALIAGLLMGFAWWFRAECLWLEPALLLGLAWARADRRLLAWVAIGIVVSLTPMAVFNLLIFGMPLGAQVAVNFTTPTAATPSALLSHRSEISITMLLGNAWPGLWWIVAAIALAFATIWADRWRLWLQAGAALLCIMYLLGPGTGLLHTGIVVACPLALLALSAWNPAYLTHAPIRLLLGTSIIFLCGVLLTTPNDGGAQWGPRYLLPILPALVIAGLTALGNKSNQPRLTQGAALTLLISAGLIAQIQGVRTLHDSTTTSLRLVQVVNAQPDQPVVTDIWYAPQLLAPIYFERTILLLNTPSDIPVLSTSLRSQGITHFSYLTSQPWGRNTQLPSQSGTTCQRVESLAYGLTLLDCTTHASS
ncbi:MAG: hypothetical protein HGA19_13855 [Oscillochloris sp.]|nr:hypothetical protein [Oscillochloris sp.]